MLFRSDIALLVFLISILILGLILVLLSLLLSYKNYVKNLDKSLSYECGFLSFNDARKKFDIVFYLLGILFIIFDLELSFLIPWSLIATETPIRVFLIIYLFIFLLGIGFFYE